mgnify:CR=1 FL=1
MTPTKVSLLKKDPAAMSFWELINYNESLSRTIALLVELGVNVGIDIHKSPGLQ